MEIRKHDRGSGQNLTDLFIFRTNINDKVQYVKVQNSLLKRPGIHGCTIDLEDCDKVLRVECKDIPMSAIVEEVGRQGFFCEELAD